MKVVIGQNRFIDVWIFCIILSWKRNLLNLMKLRKQLYAKAWEEKNLYVFYLPTYSPHLNLIETLWRQMKYLWLKPEDYISFERLTEAVKKILDGIGSQYKIKFKDRVFI